MSNNSIKRVQVGAGAIPPSNSASGNLVGMRVHRAMVRVDSKPSYVMKKSSKPSSSATQK